MISEPEYRDEPSWAKAVAIACIFWLVILLMFTGLPRLSAWWQS